MKYTVFCKQDDGHGTTYVDTFEAIGTLQAAAMAKADCAHAWGYSPEDVAVLGVLHVEMRGILDPKPDVVIDWWDYELNG